jgi:hypothetical protein
MGVPQKYAVCVGLVVGRSVRGVGDILAVLKITSIEIDWMGSIDVAIDRIASISGEEGSCLIP